MSGRVTFMGTSARTLQLLSLLQGQRYWPGAELASRLEVSLRTLRRDVDLLRELGYPVSAHRGVDGGYQLAPGAVSHRCCSTTRRRSPWRSACRPRQAATWPAWRSPRCARWPSWCR
jgi:biotin operon repressor